jgi:hypothetical protein
MCEDEKTGKAEAFPVFIRLAAGRDIDYSE